MASQNEVTANLIMRGGVEALTPQQLHALTAKGGRAEKIITRLEELRDQVNEARAGLQSDQESLRRERESGDEHSRRVEAREAAVKESEEALRRDKGRHEATKRTFENEMAERRERIAEDEQKARDRITERDEAMRSEEQRVVEASRVLQRREQELEKAQKAWDARLKEETTMLKALLDSAEAGVLTWVTDMRGRLAIGAPEDEADGETLQPTGMAAALGVDRMVT